MLTDLQSLSEAFVGATKAIESMLYNQLAAAIGKVVGPADFAEYMESR